MFRPCVLAIDRLYYKRDKQLYNMCVGYPTTGMNHLKVKWTLVCYTYPSMLNTNDEYNI
jgi:hypothetical protein